MTITAGRSLRIGDFADLENDPQTMLAGLVSQAGWVLVAGTTAWSVTALSSTTQAITYGVTFTSIPIVVTQNTVQSNKQWDCNLNGNPGLSSANIRMYQSQNSVDTANGLIHWMAFGPVS